jgi:hypothetical protein
MLHTERENKVEQLRTNTANTLLLAWPPKVSGAFSFLNRSRVGLAQKVEFNSLLACEAGERVKPGALAPGQRDETDQARETGESADSQTFARYAGCTRNRS